MPRPPKSKLTSSGAYTPETIELALTVYATTGNAARAERVVKAELGQGPGSRTILKWAEDDHYARFLEIRESVAEQIRSRVASVVEREMMETIEVQAKVREKVMADIGKLDPRDAPGALRNIATAAGILATNLEKMRPQEALRVEHTLNADELLRKIAGFIPGSVEGTAVELPAESDVAPNAKEPAEAGSNAADGVAG